MVGPVPLQDTFTEVYTRGAAKRNEESQIDISHCLTENKSTTLP